MKATINFIERLFAKWLSKPVSVKNKLPPSKGNCGVCGDPVHHVYPWWTANPDKPGAMPLHEECAKQFFWTDENCPP